MRLLAAVAKDLSEHKGRAVVMVGDSQPPRCTRSRTRSTPRSARR
jgi:hypothetical protein